MVATQVAEIMTNWWLATWADMSRDEQGEDEPRDVYIGLILATTVLSFIRSAIFMYGAIRAAKALHNSALTTVLGSPILFFDTTPVGTVLNKFSKDLGYVHRLLSPACLNWGWIGGAA
jgi:ABC-type multidrug transport system fused ATPase/permease subunit